LTLSEAIGLVPILRQLMSKNFKGSVSFKIGRLVRELDKELKLFEKERERLIKKYAEKDDNGNLIFTGKNVKILDTIQFNKEIEELLNNELNINAEKIDIEIFDDVEISPEQAMILEYIIKEKTPLV
jgi:hypothetical protein